MNRGKLLITAAFSLSMLCQAKAQQLNTALYPKPPRSTQQDTFFGTVVSDPYRWMENDSAAARKSWIKEENDLTESFLARIPFRNQIKDRITQIWNYEKYASPFFEGGFTYYYKNNGLQNQFILYRENLKTRAQIFLDPNKFSRDGTTSLAGIDFSVDGSHAAYQISEGGSDWRKVIIIDAATGKQLDDTLRDVKFSGTSWFKNEGIYYSSYDKPNQINRLSAMNDHHKVYYHKLGTAQSNDQLIFGGSDVPRRYLSAEVTEDQHYLIISAANSTHGNELYLKDLTKAGSSITPLITGFENVSSNILSHNGMLYFYTDKDAPNGKFVAVSAAAPQSANWKDLIPESKFPLEVGTAGAKIFATYLKDAICQVWQYDLSGKREKRIELPGLGTASGFNGKLQDKIIYYSFSSYVVPSTLYAYTISANQSTLYKKPKLGVNTDNLESKQVFYKSKDGTRIPMILTSKKGIVQNAKNPVLLYGYGGFNINITPAFSIADMVFLEQGGIFAVANLRGGGEYGESWHQAGIKMKKQNVFDDFIGAAEYLISEKYTTSELIAIQGGSNGGLLVGACMTQRPELFKVAFPAVGVMDMLRYQKFTAGAGWAYDYGTAQDSKGMFEYLHKYSPLHAIKKGTCYPATFINTADHDDRVVPAHSFKFTATLQGAQSCSNPVLISIQTNAGHGAGKPTSKIIQEVADRFSFMYYIMGIPYQSSL